MTDISVVIPTYNRIETLKVVIPALLNNDLDPFRYEILVADSLSNDGTAAYLAGVTAQHPRVRHLPGPYLGRAAARNAGIAAAQGVIVLFTDADIIASPDLLRRHLERHTAAGSMGVRRVAVVGMELQVSSYEEFERLRDDVAARRPLHPKRRRTVDWLYFLTGNASVRRDDLVALHGFDEDFTGYGHEDLELGYRLKKSGVSLLYEPTAVNYHWHPVPYDEQQGRMELAGRSTVRFVRKHRSPETALKLGLTPLSLGWHAVARVIPGLLRGIERAGRHNRLAREIVYQFHYISGIKAALREKSPPQTRSSGVHTNS